MSLAPTWNDWLTDSFFRVRISLAAAEKLRQLPAPEQVRIRAMLDEIAEMSGLSQTGGGAHVSSFARPLLQLRIGRVTVRYAIDEDTRTMAVEHVIIPGDEPHFGQVG